MTTKAKVALGLVAAALTALLVVVAAIGPTRTHETDALMGVYPGAGMQGYMADLPDTGVLQTPEQLQAYARRIAGEDTYYAIAQTKELYADDWSRMLAWLLLIGGVAMAVAGPGAAHLRRREGFDVTAELPDTRHL